MKMYIYAAYDNNEEQVFSPAIGVNDEDFCRYFISSLSQAYESIEKENDKKDFKRKIKSCSLVRLGVLSPDGILTNDKQLLLYLKDLDFDNYEKLKKELNDESKNRNSNEKV